MPEHAVWEADYEGLPGYFHTELPGRVGVHKIDVYPSLSIQGMWAWEISCDYPSFTKADGGWAIDVESAMTRALEVYEELIRW